MWLGMVVAFAGPVAVEVVEAQGEHQLVVDLPSFGRYAFEVHSKVGTALQVGDRDQGPGNRYGIRGESDGRVDLFWDVGQAKIITLAPTDGRGDATIEVTRFEQRMPDEGLRRATPVITELRDKEDRGWWLEATSHTTEIEVVGRYLGGVSLWRDGTWLVADAPSCTTIEATEGQPMTRCVFSERLEAGTYRLVVHGGPGVAWAEEAPDRLLSVRWGAPTLPPAGVRHARIGPTGTDYFQVHGRTNTAQLTLPENAAAAITLERLNEGNSFRRAFGTARITDKSRLPEVVSTSSGTGRAQMLTVSGTPGQRYALTWFANNTSQVTLKGSGPTLVTALSTARPADAISPTALFYRRLKDGTTLLAGEQALELKPGERITERFNLLGEAQMFVRLTEQTEVQFSLTEGQGSLRFERFFTTPPKGYKQPKARRTQWKDNHGPGVYLLSLIPDEPGIVSFEAQRNGWGDLAASTVNGVEDRRLPPGLLQVVELDEGAPLTLLQTHAPGARVGVVTRSLPLDPHVPVALTLAAHSQYKLPVQTEETLKVHATLPNGEPIPLGLFERTAPQQTLVPGSMALTLHNDSDQPVVVVLGPATRPSPSSQPPLHSPARSFPRLTDSAAFYTTLDRHARQTLEVQVAEDGLYVLQTTGLLATYGSLRSRVGGSATRVEQNGAGRNMRLARYLQSGSYQVTVGPMGSSRGHLGVELEHTAIIEGGTLLPEQIARATVPAGQGIRYGFELKQRRAVQLTSSSPGKSFGCRLEDDEGWPVIRPPQSRCALNTVLEPGRYVLVSLPADVEGKRHTRLGFDPLPPERSGRGPFELPLGNVARHTWTEPPGEGERPIDQWRFILPADLQVRINPGDEMVGTLTRDGAVIERLSPGRTWSGALLKGAYQLELRAARRGTGIAYQVRVQTDALTVGQTRSLSLPTTVPLVVGASGLVSIHSEGDADVRARLIDSDGRVLAANDDRPDDWNFQIERWLEPGTYTLQLQRVGGGRSTQVRVEAPEAVDGSTLRMGKNELPVDGQAVLHSVQISGKKPLVVHAEADQDLMIAVEQKTSTGWDSLGTATGKHPSLLARHTGGALRIRLRSLDGRPTQARLKLSRGTDITRLKSFEPGLYRVLGDRTTLRVCPTRGEPCLPASGIITVEQDGMLFGTEPHLERADLTGEPVPIELSTPAQTINTGVNGLVAFELRSLSTSAGVALVGDSATALVPGGALALGTGDAVVWGEGMGRVRAVALSSSRRGWDGSKPLSIEVPPRGAVQVTAPRSLQRVAVALEHHLAVRSGGAALWADADAVRGSLPNDGGVLLANPTNEPLLAVLSAGSVFEEGMLERFADAVGVEVLQIPAGPGRLRAHHAQVQYLGNDGAVTRLGEPTVGAGGWATVEHGRGWYAIWTEAQRAGPWSSQSIEQPIEAGVIEVRGDAAFAVRVPGQQRVDWRPDAGAVFVISPVAASVEVRGLGSTSVEVSTASVEVVSIGEGLGPEVLISSGSSRWFRFDVDQDGPVGVGVRARADRIEATVYTSTGEPLGTAVVQRLELVAGSYLLQLSQPADGLPVRARPALAGLERPDHGPPEDVVKTYARTRP